MHEERVVRVEASRKRLSLLVAPTGGFLAATETGELEVRDHVDDYTVWDGEFPELRNAASGVKADVPAGFRVVRGPSRLPSVDLATFRDQGWVCLPSILEADVVDELQRIACCGPWSEREHDARTRPILQSAAVARASTEPVSLWIMRQYLRTDRICFAHSPSHSILDPDDGQRAVQGWHCDYPYLWGTPREGGGDQVPLGTGGLLLGIQRNICVTDFTRTNGATCFKLGSHALNVGPPEEWGVWTDYMQPGHRTAHGLPYSGPDADTVEAPAGSILLYDARTWHRAGVNRTNMRRAAILQAVTPRFVMPFTDLSRPYTALLESPIMDDLNDLQRRELETLMVRRVTGRSRNHAIGLAPELD